MATEHSIARTRAEARALGLKWYSTGRRCKYGHVTERYASSGQCRNCCNGSYYRLSPEAKTARNQRAYAARKTLHGEEVIRRDSQRMSRAWKVRNNNRVLKYSREYHAAHREQQLASNKEWRKKHPQRLRELERSRQLRRRGISENEYAQRLLEQGNCCAICKATKPGGRYEVFAIDHCHQTQLNRGLLCGSCNLGLGTFKDNPALLLAAAEYLKQWQHHINSNAVDSVRRLLFAATNVGAADPGVATLPI